MQLNVVCERVEAPTKQKTHTKNNSAPLVCKKLDAFDNKDNRLIHAFSIDPARYATPRHPKTHHRFLRDDDVDDDGDDALMPLVQHRRYGSTSRYEHMAADSSSAGGLDPSGPGDEDASEMDGLNTPPAAGLPAEPSWMADEPSLGGDAGGGSAGSGIALGWRGLRERGDGTGGGGSRTRTMV